MANHYDIPSWAGKPPPGLHLDVVKEDEIIKKCSWSFKKFCAKVKWQDFRRELRRKKLMIDEKKCYLFGKNRQLNDFFIEHDSGSRVHCALVYHKRLNRAFLVDLGSKYGTYIGSIRLESTKPTQLPIGSSFRFGFSKRIYIIRERPQPKLTGDEKGKSADEIEGGLLGLPETETELDNLTEFNTAHNRRISMLGIPDEEARPVNRKRKKRGVSFNEDEEVINPEDIDPSVGKFRNLIQSTVIPAKQKRKLEPHPLDTDIDFTSKHFASLHYRNLYEGIAASGSGLGDHANNSSLSVLFPSSLSGKLGLSMPNPAPEVESIAPPIDVIPNSQQVAMDSLTSEPKKKKYAKEAWPGKKPAPSLLV